VFLFSDSRARSSRHRVAVGNFGEADRTGNQRLRPLAGRRLTHKDRHRSANPRGKPARRGEEVPRPIGEVRSGRTVPSSESINHLKRRVSPNGKTEPDRPILDDRLIGLRPSRRNRSGGSARAQPHVHPPKSALPDDCLGASGMASCTQLDRPTLFPAMSDQLPVPLMAAADLATSRHDGQVQRQLGDGPVLRAASAGRPHS